MTFLRRTIRILGNFGISFFGPLISTNIASSFFKHNMTFDETLIISLISALFVTGLSISREAVDWGSENAKK